LLSVPRSRARGEDVSDHLLIAPRPLTVTHGVEERVSTRQHVRQAMRGFAVENLRERRGRSLGLGRPDRPVRPAVEDTSFFPGCNCDWSPHTLDHHRGRPTRERDPANGPVGPEGHPSPVGRDGRHLGILGAFEHTRLLAVECAHVKPLDPTATAHEHERSAVGCPGQCGA
jgi:hypothetical protein